MEHKTCAELLQELNALFENCDDFVLRPINGNGVNGAVCFIKNICDRKYISDRVAKRILAASLRACWRARPVPCATRWSRL